nr:uncharacterized protein LOC111422743 [Onthophagus taurus]
MVLKYTILHVVFLTLVPAFIKTADKKCHKISLIKNFDVERIIGYWYAQEVGDSDSFESTKKCLFYNVISNKKKSNATITILRIFNVTGAVAKTEMITSQQIYNTSEFLAKWKQEGEIRSIWAVATDYDTWSTWYICQPEHAERGMLFITTREQNPNKETLEAARNAARKEGFKMTKPYLKQIDHSQCFN